MKIRLIFFAVLFFLAGCRKEGISGPTADPYTVWKSHDLHNYTIDQIRSCFCPYAGEEMRLTIRSDTVYKAIRIADSVELAITDARSYYPIERMFEITRSVSIDSLVVRYNVRYGYPEYLDIYPQLHPIDGGALYETSNLQLLQ